jgi:hypothetical protein
VHGWLTDGDDPGPADVDFASITIVFAIPSFMTGTSSSTGIKFEQTAPRAQRFAVLDVDLPQASRTEQAKSKFLMHRRQRSARWNPRGMLIFP